MTRVTLPVYRIPFNEAAHGGLHGIEFVRLADLLAVTDLEVTGPLWGGALHHYGLEVKDYQHKKRLGEGGTSNDRIGKAQETQE